MHWTLNAKGRNASVTVGYNALFDEARESEPGGIVALAQMLFGAYWNSCGTRTYTAVPHRRIRAL